MPVRRICSPRWVYVFGAALAFHVSAVRGWTSQMLPESSSDLHQRVSIVDINNDDAADLIFCGGSDSSTTLQPYLRMNNGHLLDGTFQFSDPMPIGGSGEYVHCEVGWLPAEGVYGLLVVSSSVATLYGVSVDTCNFWSPEEECNLQQNELWSYSDQNLREGAFLTPLDESESPSIVLLSRTSVSVFDPTDGEGSYSTVVPNYKLRFNDENDNDDDDDNENEENDGKGSHLASGSILGDVGFVVGKRKGNRGEFTAVYKRNNEYTSSPLSSDIVPGKNVMADIDGNGVDDIVAANLEAAPSMQSYFLLDGASVGPVGTSFLYESNTKVVGLALGLLFETSTLPDCVLALDDGTLVVLENNGIDEATGLFGGFSDRSVDPVLSVPQDCSIQDVDISQMWPCTVSIAISTDCSDNAGNFLFTQETCNIEDWLGNLAPSAPISPSSPMFSPNPPAFFPTGISPTEGGRLVPTSPSSPASPVSLTSPTTSIPSDFPSAVPFNQPSPQPSQPPSSSPSSTPTSQPTSTPSAKPSTRPTDLPSSVPSVEPSLAPSHNPSIVPTANPTPQPSLRPSQAPSESPSTDPTIEPTQPDEPLIWVNATGTSSGDPALGGWQIIMLIVGGTVVVVFTIAFAFARSRPNPGKVFLPQPTGGSAPSIQLLELVYDDLSETSSISGSRLGKRAKGLPKAKFYNKRQTTSIWGRKAPSDDGGNQTDVSSAVSVYISSDSDGTKSENSEE